jgi:UDP-N-acetylmuramyl pentapeptide synthase
MLALAVGEAFGITPAMAAPAIAAMAPPPMRGAAQPLGEALLLDDCYNANPASMRAALDLLDAMAPERPAVAVLGGMRELGAQAAAMHDDVARRAVASRAVVLAGVEAMGDALRRVAPDDPRVVTAPDPDALWPLLAPRLPRQGVLLLKASRGIRLERLVPPLRDWAGTAGATPG